MDADPVTRPPEEMLRHAAWVRRLAVALSRIRESEDDELAYAYYAANARDQVYQRRRFTEAYKRRALSCYQPRHVERAVAMTMKAAGLAPQSRLAKWAGRAAFWQLKLRSRISQAAQ